MSKANPFNRSKPESNVLGALTRVALWFQFQDRSFTGKEVAEILIAGWHSYEGGKRTTDVAFELPAVGLESGQTDPTKD